MRKLGIVVGVFCVLGTASVGSADVIKPQIQPQARLVPTTRILTVARVGTGHYTGGAIMWDVGVENLGTTASTVQVHVGGTTQPINDQSLDIPPKTTKQVVFVDASGLDSVCKAYDYTVTLAGPLADTHPRQVKLTQTCTVKTKVTDPWDTAIPDRVEEAKQKHIYAQNVVVTVEPTCTTGMRLTGNVTNNTSKAVDLALGAFVGNKQVMQGPRTLGAGKTENVLIGGLTEVDVGVLPYTIKVTDQSAQVTPSFVNQGITLIATRSCKLDVELRP